MSEVWYQTNSRALRCCLSYKPVPETPLNRQVAEALGWSHIGPGNTMNIGDRGIGYPPSSPIVGRKVELPDYEREWADTGPLLVRHGISFGPVSDGWRAELDIPNGYAVIDPDPLRAICRLIVNAHGAGKL